MYAIRSYYDRGLGDVDDEEGRGAQNEQPDDDCDYRGNETLLGHGCSSPPAGLGTGLDMRSKGR